MRDVSNNILLRLGDIMADINNTPLSSTSSEVRLTATASRAFSPPRNSDQRAKKRERKREGGGGAIRGKEKLRGDVLVAPPQQCL